MIRKIIRFIYGVLHGAMGERARLRAIILEASKECDILVAKSRHLRDRRAR